MGTPDKLFDGAVLYTRILYLGVPAQLMYNFCAAILRAVGDTKRPTYILGATGIVNVLLNLIFVIVFHIDVAGVAIATIVAQYLSAIIALLLLMKSEAEFRIVPRKIRIYKNELKEILKNMDVEAFGEVGDEFDPNIHSAVMTVENDELPENSIAAVFEKGYKMGDRILRFATVQVTN
jgi:Na+-driven multidrug efflux pump